MRRFSVFGTLLLIAFGCATQRDGELVQDEDTPSDGGSTAGKASAGNTGKGGSSSSGGKTSTGGKTGGAGKTGSDAGSPDAGDGGDTGEGGASSGTGGGGKAGSGGKGGTGGSGGSGCSPSSDGPIQGISARYEPEEKTVSGYSIGAKLYIHNTGQSTLALADLQLRYYFTNEVTATIDKTVNWGWFKPGDANLKGAISFEVVPMSCTGNGANAYFEFSFDDTAGSLAPNTHVEFSFSATNIASQKFEQADDYSFDLGKTQNDDNPKIVIIKDGSTRVWGTEP